MEETTSFPYNEMMLGKYFFGGKIFLIDKISMNGMKKIAGEV